MRGKGGDLQWAAPNLSQKVKRLLVVNLDERRLHAHLPHVSSPGKRRPRTRSAHSARQPTDSRCFVGCRYPRRSCCMHARAPAANALHVCIHATRTAQRLPQRTYLPRCQRTRGYRPSRRAPSTRGRRSRRSGCCRTSPTGRSHSARHWHWAVSAQRRPPAGPVPRCMVRAHAESGWNCSKRQQSAGGVPESALQHQAAAQPLLESFSSIPGCAHRFEGLRAEGRGGVPGRRRCCRFCPNRSASRASFGRRCLSHPPAPPHARPRVRPRCLARVKCSSRWRSDATL